MAQNCTFSNKKSGHFQRLLTSLNAKRSGNGWIALCPAHDDHDPSLSITERDGKVLVNCLAGCSQEDVISALRKLDLWPKGKSRGSFDGQRNNAAPPDFRSRFEYLRRSPIPDEASAYLIEKRGLAERIVKDLIDRGLMTFSLKKNALVFPITSHDQRTIVGLQYIPIDGTTKKTLAAGSSMENGFWFYGQPGDSEHAFTIVTEAIIDALSVASAFEGANVVSVLSAGTLPPKLPKIQTSGCPPILFMDNDQAGQESIRKVLASGNKDVHLIDYGQFPSGMKDANDLLCGGHGDLIGELIRSSRVPTEEEITEALSRVTVGDDEDDDFNPKPWPTLSDRALRGLAGTFVELATRSSEGDPAAVLATFLSRFGVEVGRKPHMMIGDTRHGALINAVIVGNSSKARKGTSGAPVTRLFNLYKVQEDDRPSWAMINDDLYKTARETSGPLSSGEGLIYAVRDEVGEWVANKKTGEGKIVITDPGVTDKRLFVLDEEFAAALNSTKRDGNTLSAIIRAAFDGKDLEPLTKRDRIKASGAHIGIVTHVTTFELHQLLESTQVLNGFANRFLWICARRQKLVPFPEPMPEDELKKLQRELLKILQVASQIGLVTLDKNARDAWYSIYPDVSQEYPGLVGCVINRGEALVMRTALHYALLDVSPVITLDHLDAALAFWAYSKESTEYIFAGREMNPLGQKVLDALKRGALSLTEIYELFSNHASKGQVRSILSELISSGRITMEEERTSGRTRKIFSYTPDEKRDLSESRSNVSPLNSLNSHGVCEKQDPEESPAQGEKSEISEMRSNVPELNSLSSHNSHGVCEKQDPEESPAQGEKSEIRLDPIQSEKQDSKAPTVQLAEWATGSGVSLGKKPHTGLDFNTAGPQPEDEPQRKPVAHTWMPKDSQGVWEGDL